ncbi:MAG: phosphatidylglycerol lysyltransferase domain-containing protein [Victivallales bacterium]
MGLIKSDDFKPVEMSDKDYLQDVFFKFELLPCEYVFTNLFVWRNIYDVRWMKFRNAILIHSGLDKTLLMPIGNVFTPEELKDLLCSTFPSEEDASITQVPENYMRQNPSVSNIFETELDDKFADYIYSTEKLYLLRGAKLAKKKNLLSQFARGNPGYTCTPLREADLGECLELTEKWRLSTTSEPVTLAQEEEAIREAFANYKDLGIEGTCIFVEGKIAAFSVFTFQSSDAAVVHFEKYDKDLKGSAQAINWETAKSLLGRCKYINREQDIGLPGLKKAKLSYDPDKIMYNYTLSLK